jgi:hypothetical protein
MQHKDWTIKEYFLCGIVYNKVGAESIVAANIIVAATFAALFSTLKLFFPNFFNILKLQSILNKNIKNLNLKNLSTLDDTAKIFVIVLLSFSPISGGSSEQFWKGKRLFF